MLSSIYTLNQLTNILSDAQVLRRALMKSTKPDWSKLSNELNPDTTSLLVPVLKKASNPLSELDSLIESLNNHQVVEVTTAIELDNDLTTQVGTFLKKQLGDTTVFSNVVNPRLVGGAQISFQGRFRDYSLASAMQSFFQSTKILWTQTNYSTNI